MKKDDFHAKNVLIVGAGYTGGRVAKLFHQKGASVFTISRNKPALPLEIGWTQGDVSTSIMLPLVPDLIIYCVSAGKRCPERYRSIYVEGPQRVLDACPGFQGRMMLVSSTGVYGHTQGETVNETTPPAPNTETGALLLQGEQHLHQRHEDTVTIRLSGIYGPGRDRFVRKLLSSGSLKEVESPDRFVNHIHVEDAASMITFLATQETLNHRLYIGSDLASVTRREMAAWVLAYVQSKGTAADLGHPPHSFTERGTHKRCCSRRIVESGYHFQYPTYREGYAPLIEKIMSS